MHMAWSGLSDRRDKDPQPPRSWGYSGHGVQHLRPHHHHNESKDKSPKSERSPKPAHKEKGHKHSHDKKSRSPLHSPHQDHRETSFLLFPASPTSSGKDSHSSPKSSSPVSTFFGRSPKSSPRSSPKSPEKMFCWVSFGQCDLVWVKIWAVWPNFIP